VLIFKVPEEAFPDLEEADIQELLSSLAAELAEKGLEQLTAPAEPEEKKILAQKWRVLS
jgi:hypothetical protein